jgi:hypothetical protein
MYTKEETEYLTTHYDGHNVDELAKHLNKSPRSVIGKLSKLGIYQKKEYLNKRGERPVTKLELVASIAETLNVEPEQLEGLDKTPKEVLRLIVEKLETP